MHATAPPFTAYEETPLQGSSSLWELAELCLQQTAMALQEARVATPHEIAQAIARTREDHARQRPSDLLETLARVQGHEEEHLGPVILALGDQVASTLTPYAPYIPFAGKLMAPSAFYESFDRIHQTARTILTPVIFAEDTDSIGIASVNPVAAALLAEEVKTAVHKRFGIRAFMTVARLDYESWTFLTRKHFEL